MEGSGCSHQPIPPIAQTPAATRIRSLRSVPARLHAVAVIAPTQAPCIADTPKSGLTAAAANILGSAICVAPMTAYTNSVDPTWPTIPANQNVRAPQNRNVATASIPNATRPTRTGRSTMSALAGSTHTRPDASLVALETNGVKGSSCARVANVSPATAQMSPRPLAHPANDAHARHTFLVSASVRGKEPPSPRPSIRSTLSHTRGTFPHTLAQTSAGTSTGY